MSEFWEDSFVEKQTMWGFEPTGSAIWVKDFFLEKKVKNILIPGIGYGRNAKPFIDNGIKVTGIEISQTAIALARQYLGSTVKIYHGSVTDMPFDTKHYDGIYCYGLIHLLNSPDRKKLIKACYDQLQPGAYMFFVTIAKSAPMFGKGRQLSKDRFETMKGVKIFFYDSDSIKREFGQYGLIDIQKITEQGKHKPSLDFLIVKCQKN